MSPFRKLAFVINQQKNGATKLARELIANARNLPPGYFKGWDAGCVIGGDGTLLGTVRGATRANIPLIGVNQGSLGYLTTFSPEEARAHFTELIQGSYRLASRTLLDCQTGARRRDLALNDVLIKAEMNSR